MATNECSGAYTEVRGHQFEHHEERGKWWSVCRRCKRVFPYVPDDQIAELEDIEHCDEGAAEAAFAEKVERLFYEAEIRERIKAAVQAMDRVSVFVTTRERIRDPDGAEWWQRERDNLRECLVLFPVGDNAEAEQHMDCYRCDNERWVSELVEGRSIPCPRCCCGVLFDDTKGFPRYCERPRGHTGKHS